MPICRCSCGCRYSRDIIWRRRVGSLLLVGLRRGRCNAVADTAYAGIACLLLSAKGTRATIQTPDVSLLVDMKDSGD
jgi:hypothetical protein